MHRRGGGCTRIGFLHNRRERREAEELEHPSMQGCRAKEVERMHVRAQEEVLCEEQPCARGKCARKKSCSDRAWN